MMSCAGTMNRRMARPDNNPKLRTPARAEPLGRGRVRVPTANYSERAGAEFTSTPAYRGSPTEGARMVRTILLIFLILLLLGSLPMWPYSHGWGYYPSGGFGLVLLIVILVLLFG